MAEAEKPHYHGHRDRLRKRFLEGKPDALPDYELIELLLFMAIPRRDVKEDAKRLLKEFGGFAELLTASPEELTARGGLSEVAAVALKTVEAAAVRLARQKARRKPVLGNWQALLDYCHAAMAAEKTERFHLIFLDTRNRILADEAQQRGTVDHTPVYPREVIKRALELGATALVLVHNHPSGDPSPSKADIEMTRRIVEAAETVGIAVHDHLIIGKGEHTSFKTLGLL
jgi:DNA repair protein RadC